MKIAVFGGSFDPIHRGHLAVADAVQDRLRPDLLLWVPARAAPHKPGRCPAPAADRAALIEAVLAGRPGERLCRLELEREPPSYTVDTLEELARLHPGAEFLLVLGGDSQEHWPNWRRRERILELATPVWFPRPGWERLRPGVPGRMLAMELVPISSSRIRAALARGEDCSRWLPPAVAAEIAARGLYRA
ncbi:MAG: nicotinate (nicotinamide) nucleotide adenylyltransferase [Planctomycetota bacterium]|nr:MAG: nicotinate (nicotinamide) nucleotide adenylyltransferase [Planctomycetota bacterium]